MARSPQKPSVWRPFLRRFADERAEDVHHTEGLRSEVTSAWRATPFANERALDVTADSFLTLVEANAMRIDQAASIPASFRPCVRQAIYELLALEQFMF